MSEKKFRLLVFDRPVAKDWAFWHGVAWSLVIGIAAIVDPVPDSTTPLWVDVPGVAVMTFFLRSPLHPYPGALHRTATERVDPSRGYRRPTQTPRP